MDIIIDGYNLIFACGFNAAMESPQGIARSRARLLNLLVEYLDQRQRLKTTVVFDAEKLPRNEPAIDARRQDIRVLFAVGYPDADTLIEHLIQQHSHPKRLTVVSSDHRIQTAAERRRALTIDSDRWLDRLEKQGPRDSRQPNDAQQTGLDEWGIKDRAVDPKSTAHWLSIFDDTAAEPNSKPAVDEFDPLKPTEQSSATPELPTPISPVDLESLTAEPESDDDQFASDMLKLDDELKRLLDEEP